jgi:hypothetical protein
MMVQSIPIRGETKNMTITLTSWVNNNDLCIITINQLIN